MFREFANSARVWDRPIWRGVGSNGTTNVTTRLVDWQQWHHAHWGFFTPHLGLDLLHGTGDLGLKVPGGKRPRSEMISKRGHHSRRMGDEGLEPPTSRM